jgi:hypothetical protein
MPSDQDTLSSALTSAWIVLATYVAVAVLAGCIVGTALWSLIRAVRGYWRDRIAVAAHTTWTGDRGRRVNYLGQSAEDLRDPPEMDVAAGMGVARVQNGALDALFASRDRRSV